MMHEDHSFAPARWWKPRSLRGRTFGALLLTGLLPVLLLGWYSFLLERRRAIAVGLASLADSSQDLAAHFDRYLASSATLVQHLTMSSEITSFMAGKPTGAHSQAMNAWLKGHCSLDKDVSALILVRPDGLCVASSEPAYIGANYAFRSYFRDALMGRSQLSDEHIGLRIRAPFVGISQAVRRDGVLLGVLFLRVSMDKVHQAITAQSSEGRNLFLINSDGIILAHSDPALNYSAIAPILPARLSEIVSSRQFMGREHPVVLNLPPGMIQTVFRTLATGQQGQAHYTRAGKTRWVALQRLEVEPWVMGVAVDEGTLFAHSRRILLLTTLVCLFTLLLVVLGSLWVSRKIFAPLGDLKKAMEGFGSGQPRARAPEDGQDEVALLGRQFNVMADTIQAQTETLAKRVDTLEGILPICSSCHKIRDEDGGYQPLETYVATHTQAKFSHGLCEECARKLYPDFYVRRKG